MGEGALAMTSRDHALVQIERLITECEHRIAGQREIIADAVEKGRDATMAESMLRAFEQSLRAFEKHRQYILNWPAKRENDK
jgi:hypothetical protein